MPTLSDLDLADLMNTSLRDVFETMLSMELKPAADAGAASPPLEEQIIGFVGLAGPVQGAVYFRLSDAFARQAASTMLGLAPEELGPAEVNDVVGELTNMIGGNIKSRLNDCGFKCNLSVPSVVRGQEIDIKTLGLDSGRIEHRTFAHQDQLVRLTVAVKEGNAETTV